MRSIIKKYISTNYRNRIRYALPSLFSGSRSYSQSGEDLIIAYLLGMIVGQGPKRYLDIGANHPFIFSNTAKLYKSGGSGVLVEPDPYFARLLRKKRPRDTVLEMGVHFSGDPRAQFFILDSPTLNTFSEVEASRYESMGHKILKTIEVKLIDVNDLLSQSGDLDLLNIDIEGLDLEVLERIDWKTYRPKCVCVESIHYENSREPYKIDAITSLMRREGYMLYADTFINSIFVDRLAWQKHWLPAAV